MAMGIVATTTARRRVITLLSALMSVTSEPPLRVAIIHYWLVGMRGGERVLERVLRLFPEADVFTHVYNPEAVSALIRSRKVTSTFINRLPASNKLYQRYLPLMPMALESLDLKGYDLVLSFEAGPAKGVIAPPDALHVCYCHSPMRYLWDAYGEYRESAGRLSRWAMLLLFPWLRLWDFASSGRVDGFIANSHFIRKRIRRAYARDSVVVHPPAPVEAFHRSPSIGESYLWVGQMTPYKRGDIAVEAFNKLGLPLRMIGKGEMQSKLKAAARSNITFTEGLSFKELGEAYASCKGLIYTAEEDFGIIPVEAMAAGRPVLAFGRGGVLDTIRPGVSGLFFEAQTADSLIDGVERMEAWLPRFEPESAIEQASGFGGARFDHEFMAAVAGYAEHHPRVRARLASQEALMEREAEVA